MPHPAAGSGCGCGCIADELALAAPAAPVVLAVRWGWAGDVDLAAGALAEVLLEEQLAARSNHTDHLCGSFHGASVPETPAERARMPWCWVDAGNFNESGGKRPVAAPCFLLRPFRLWCSRSRDLV